MINCKYGTEREIKLYLISTELDELIVSYMGDK